MTQENTEFVFPSNELKHHSGSSPLLPPGIQVFGCLLNYLLGSCVFNDEVAGDDASTLNSLP